MCIRDSCGVPDLLQNSQKCRVLWCNCHGTHRSIGYCGATVTELTEVVCGVTTDGNYPRYRSVGTLQNLSDFFDFNFPFGEIYRRLLFFTLGRSFSAWIDYSTTKWKWNVLLVGPARCFFLFLSTLLRKIYGDGCCTELSETFRVRLWEKTCESWLQDVLLLLSFLLWCSVLQVLRSGLITTNY